MAKLSIIIDWIPAFAGMTEIGNKKELQTKPTLVKFIIIWVFTPCYRACAAIKSWEFLSEDLFEYRDKPCFVWLVRASSAAPNF